MHNAEKPLRSLESAEQSPADRFRVDPKDYPIFDQQYELDDRWGNNSHHRWNIDKTLSYYVTYTANLISRIDGTSTEFDKNPELAKPDHIIYLDKSARPVSWLVNTFWSDFAEGKPPENSYLNIDRLDWFARSGVEVDVNGYSKNPDGSPHRNNFSDFRPENLDDEDYARIRGLYIPKGIPNEDAAEIMQTPSSLDGKNILIVDEVARSGATLEIAKYLISHAFPEAKSVQGAYFWSSGSKTSLDGQEQQMLSVPVWYDSTTSEGRGAGEIDPAFYRDYHERFQTNRTRAQKYGSIVLGAIPDLTKEKTHSSRELMREITQMRQDFDDGKIILRCPANYSDDRAEAAIEAQGLRLAPASDPIPNNFINTVKAIDARPASE